MNGGGKASRWFFSWHGLFLSSCMQIHKSKFCICLHSELVMSVCGTCLLNFRLNAKADCSCPKPSFHFNFTPGLPILLHATSVSQNNSQLISLLMPDHCNMSGPTFCCSSSTGGYTLITSMLGASRSHAVASPNHSTLKNDVPVSFVKHSGISFISWNSLMCQ